MNRFTPWIRRRLAPVPGLHHLLSRLRVRSIAVKILILQLLALGVVGVAVVSAITIQARNDAIADARQRSRAVAESFAQAPGLPQAMKSDNATALLQFRAETVRKQAGVDALTVFDTKGIRITHPDESRIGSRITGPEWVIRRELAGERITRIFEASQGPSVVSAAPVRTADGTFVGGVSVGVKIATVESIASRRLPVLLGAVGGSLAFFAGVTVLLTHRMARNVGSVAHAAHELAVGNLQQRAEIRSEDEIGSMAASFNTMADRLQKSYRELQESHREVELKVGERTAQLRHRTEALGVLQQVTAAANTSESWEAALRAILPLVCRHMAYLAGHAYLVVHRADSATDYRGPDLTPSQTWHTGVDGPWAGKTMQRLMRAGDDSRMTLLHEVLATGEPGFVGLTGDAREVLADVGEEAVGGRVMVPVRVGAEVAAVLDFFTPEDRPPRDDAIRLLLDVATQLGRVIERERSEAALRESVKAAEAAARAKSAFLATMSHEIRTPMNAVIGMTELLLDTEMTSEQRQFGEIVYNSADSLLSIINDILDFSKFEAGKIELEEMPVETRTCIESAFDVVAAKAAEKEDLELAYIIAPGVPDEVITDGTRLRQVLINLLSNAVKFTAAGEVILSVQCDPREESEPVPGSHENGENSIMLHFAVRDTGIGMEPDRMKQLFRPFEQLDSSTTRRFGGTGLGLAISKRLVETMGGRIWAESKVGVGSTFHCTLPTREVPLELRMRQVKTLTELATKRLLVVDDNPTNRMILIHQAASWSMKVRATGLQSEALEWIRTGEPFDVGILDMHMPGMDGITLCQEIRQYRGKVELPLLLLTSVGRPDVPASELVEFASCHSKPVKARQLYEGLCRALHRREGAEKQPQSEDRLSHGRSKVETAVPEPGRMQVRILLAEDNAVNSQLATRMLEKLGYTADAVENGVRALEALGSRPYDIILMDVQMPEMGGIEATRRIYQDFPADRRPKIIALTASAMAEDREECMAAGMDDFLSKPIHSDALAAMLERYRPPASPTEPIEVREASPSAHNAEKASHETTTAIETAVIKKLHEFSDPEFVATLIEAFLQDSPNLVHMIEQGIAQQDIDRLRLGAHTLKSNAETFGIRDLVPLCQTAEDDAAVGNCEEASRILPKIQHLHREASALLRKIQSELRR